MEFDVGKYYFFADGQSLKCVQYDGFCYWCGVCDSPTSCELLKTPKAVIDLFVTGQLVGVFSSSDINVREVVA